MIYILVLVYALVRWGSGREIVIGLAVVLVAAVIGTVADYTGPADVIGGFGILAGAAAAERRSATAPRAGAGRWTRSAARSGSASRASCTTWSPTTSRRSRERRRAGRWPGSDQAGLEALAVIEGEASRTLAEMRAMVRVLRDGAPAEYAPSPASPTWRPRPPRPGPGRRRGGAG